MPNQTGKVQLATEIDVFQFENLAWQLGVSPLTSAIPFFHWNPLSQEQSRI